MSAYPNAEDYFRAVQRPDLTIRAPALKYALFEVHPVFGTPMPASGNAAVVFKARLDGVDQALRFFIREDAASKERYDALARHFVAHGLTDCVASTMWIDDAIEINSKTWPVVQMEWVDGRTLDAYVAHLADRSDVGALHTLAADWRHHIRRLQTADFAHGDLQHGNVLIDTSSTLRLVDFDGSWIEPFQGWPPPKETGNPNYQRTGRTWGRWMDSFPGLVIYTGLLALSRRPDAWRALHNGENMLFSQHDYRPPFDTKAWRLLAEIEDPEVASVVRRLQECCAPDWGADGPMEELLGRQRVEAAPIPAPRPAVEDDPNLPWWEKTAGVPVGAGHPGTAMPPPPPKAGPLAAPPETPAFVGVSPAGGWHGQTGTPTGRAGGPGWPAPPGQPRPPRSQPSSPRIGQSLAIAGGIAVLAALLAAIIVGASGARGSGVAAAFWITAVVAFIIALASLAARKR